jgi:hypothetical protein
MRLQWRAVGSSRAVDIPFTEDEIGRIRFTLPADLEFGRLELNGMPVTGYFKPDNPEFVWQLRPYLFAPEKK